MKFWNESKEKNTYFNTTYNSFFLIFKIICITRIQWGDLEGKFYPTPTMSEKVLENGILFQIFGRMSENRSIIWKILEFLPSPLP